MITKTIKIDYKIILIISLLLFAALSTLSASNAASNIYVNGSSGNDDWDGTNATYQGGIIGPKATIQNGTNTVDDSGTVNVADGTYQEHITINKNVNLIGQSQSGTIIDGTNNGKVVLIRNGIVNITNFTIQNGNSGAGAGVYNSGTSILNNCNIQQNSATGSPGSDGGGIYNDRTLILNNCNIQQNTAIVGGGISNEGSLTLNNCNLHQNTANIGGGISNYDYALTITNSNLTQNTAQYGGAIFGRSGIINITNSIVSANTAQYGAAIYAEENPFHPGQLNIVNTLVENNIGELDGAITNYLNLTIEKSIFRGNRATNRNGGAIVNYNDGTLTIKTTTFENNFAGELGGVIYNENYRNIFITDSKFIGNTAEMGGAIYSDQDTRNQNDAIFTIKNSQIIGNSATDSGGAIYNYNGKMIINFNRIVGNTAPTASNIYSYAERTTTDAKYNWWGSNNGPESSSLSGLTTEQYTPWLVMNYSANPNTIMQGETSELTADFRYDSNGVFHDPLLGHLPDETPVTFTTTLGNVGSKSVVIGTLNGVATATLRADEAAGTALTSAILDSQTLSTNVKINAATPNNNTNNTNTVNTVNAATNTVTMQETGIPVVALILALFMVLGGIVSSKR